MSRPKASYGISREETPPRVSLRGLFWLMQQLEESSKKFKKKKGRFETLSTYQASHVGFIKL